MDGRRGRWPSAAAAGGPPGARRSSPVLRPTCRAKRCFRRCGTRWPNETVAVQAQHPGRPCRRRRGPPRRLGSSVTETLLLDNSAWARFGDAALDDDRVTELADALEAGRVATWLPLLLE